MANALTALAFMFRVSSNDEVQPIIVRLIETLVHCAQIEDEVDKKPCYYDIRRYIKDQQYPEHASENDKRILRRLATCFLLDGEILYKERKDQALFR